MKSRRDRKTSVKKIININHKIILDFFLKGVYVSFRCRRCSSVVEHVIGNDGVASPILASGTIFDILKTAILNKLSDFLSKRQENQAFH